MRYRDRIDIPLPVDSEPGVRSWNKTTHLDLSYNQASTINQPTIPESYGTTLNYRDYSRTRSVGVNIPGYRELIKRGDDATTGLTGTNFHVHNRGRISTRIVGVRSFETGLKWYHHEFYDGPPQTFWALASQSAGSVPQSLKDLAKTRFVSKCRSAQGALSGVALLEYREAIRTVMRPLSGIRDILGHFIAPTIDRGRKMASSKSWKRMSRSQRIDALNKGIANQWLEVRFALLPMQQDVASIVDALTDDRFSLPRIPIRAVVRREEKSSQLVSDLLGSTGWKCNYNVITVDDMSVTLRGSLRLSEDGQVSLSDKLGLNLQSVVPTLWEIIPGSFLIDYVTNVGDYLSALTFDRSKLTWANWTIRSSRRMYAILNQWFPPGGAANYKYGYPSQTFVPPAVEFSNVTRSRFTETFVPDLRVSLDEINLVRGLNLAALVASSKRASKVLQTLL